MPIAILVLIASILYSPAFFGYDPLIPYSDSLDFFLTVAITLFAAVEGYSTYMQVKLSQNRNLIEDARNELEKAYGPLHTIINNFNLKFDQEGFWLTVDEKINLDRIMATYPFMFPSEINDLWRKKTPSAVAIQSFKIPLEFRNKINKEYHRRVKRYNKLLKK